MAHAFRQRVEVMLGRVFARLGAPAVYTPAGGGAALACVVVPEVEDNIVMGDVFDSRLRQTGRRFAILKSAIADRPLKDATLAIEGEGTFTVREEATSQDRFQLVWVCVTGDPA